MQDSDRRARPWPRAYEHPWAVRFTHWANAVSLTILTGSGLQIFMAFPSFGPKVPQRNLVDDIPQALRLGDWLGGALQWHFTFMWIFMGGAALYTWSLITSGHHRAVLFRPADLRGVWPMVRHYFFFAAKPKATGPYNALQKLAYTSTLACGALSVVTGLVMYKPVQLSGLGDALGGFHTARLLHFAAMCGLLAFIPGHVVMVVLHGWDNFLSMVTGRKHWEEENGDAVGDAAPPVEVVESSTSRSVRRPSSTT